MRREDRLELVKKALRLLVDQLRDDDRIGIVVFGTTARVLLEPVTLGESVALVAGVYRRSDGVGEGQAEGGLTGRRSILEAIDSLPDEERETFGLVRIQGMTQTEAAVVLGVSAKTVQRRLAAGLVLLTQSLGDLHPAPLTN